MACMCLTSSTSECAPLLVPNDGLCLKRQSGMFGHQLLVTLAAILPFSGAPERALT